MSCKTSDTVSTCITNGCSGVPGGATRQIVVDVDDNRYHVKVSHPGVGHPLDELSVSIEVEKGDEQRQTINIGALSERALSYNAGVLAEQIRGEILRTQPHQTIGTIAVPTDVAFLAKALRAYPDRAAFESAIQKAIPDHYIALANQYPGASDDTRMQMNPARWAVLRAVLPVIGFDEVLSGEALSATRIRAYIDKVGGCTYIQNYLCLAHPYHASLFTVIAHRLSLEPGGNPSPPEHLAAFIADQVVGVLAEKELNPFDEKGRNKLYPVYPEDASIEGVRRALELGQPVPDEVVMQYPNLVAEFGV